MSAILFGSISTLADTSELQREAFNQAFQDHGLDWQWNQDDYRALLTGNGGAARIADYAAERGQTVDAEAVHATKSKNFQQALTTASLSARPGVAETIKAAKDQGIQLGLVTTTSRANIAALLDALAPNVQTQDFDVITDVASVATGKPDPSVYAFALDSLGVSADAAVAIEDNLGGVQAAQAAGLACVAFANENTAAAQDFSAADRQVDRIELSQLQALIPTT